MDTKKVTKYLSSEEAQLLGLTVKPNEKGRSKARYSVTIEQFNSLEGLKREDTDTSANDYTEKEELSAVNPNTRKIMKLDDYCDFHGLPREDVTSYKLITHTGTPYYNIVFKENILEEVKDIDFEWLIEKYAKKVKRVSVKPKTVERSKDFDTLTYTDVHVGMETNKYGNSLYPVEWDRVAILDAAVEMAEATINEQESNVLYVDELGDFLDGFNAQTTRGGHELPQNMTNEEAFDCALEFKITVLDLLALHYETIVFNNICNDNHAGAFGYFVNSAFKQIAERKYRNVKVNNHRRFLNHYFAGDTCYIITHGKDDSTLKFGFKPFLDAKAVEKIDQYCKQYGIYSKCSKVVFKKGDSHQCLLDMCTSDDFYYFNYPALSPSSQWVQNNFKKGRRGFVVESSDKGRITLKPFLK